MKRLRAGTSGNFDGYGDLGAWVPPSRAGNGLSAARGRFDAIVGCNLGLIRSCSALEVGEYPIVTLEKQLPNMIGNLV